MKEIIKRHLDKIEKEYKVKIILACESGSRAWGFPSNDSDYDVRFIYVNTKNWYLTIDEKRDVIELPINNELDINGWDLRKSLKLLRKSNSPLLEWLSSPMKYRFLDRAVDPIVKLSKKAFMPETSCYHYLSMAKNSISKIQTGEKIKIKTYMYALRPILCCKWIVKNLSQPPLLIDELIAIFLNDNELRENIINLINVKKKHPENFLVQRSILIDTYLNEQIAELSNNIPKNPPQSSIEEFDNVFIEILNNVSIKYTV